MSLLNMTGEVNIVNQRNEKMFFQVDKPGLKTNVRIDLLTDSVSIRRTGEGAFRAMNYLHMMPGPHNVKLRGNYFFMNVWKVLSDAVVYLILFLTSSGVFLWVYHKEERRSGLISLTAGALLFLLILFLLYGI
jgi:hypothetical protein